MQQTISRLLWLLAGAALALFLLFFAYRAWLVLPFPHQVEYGEGSVLDGAQQIARGQLPYKPIASFPWNFSVYTPGYLAASAVGVRLFPENPWVGGRLLSLGSALVLAWLLYISTRREGEGPGLFPPHTGRSRGSYSMPSAPSPRPPRVPAHTTRASTPGYQEDAPLELRGMAERKQGPGVPPSSHFLPLPGCREWEEVRGGRGWTAWLVPLLWLASPYLFRWSMFFRPDLFALAWSAAGVVLVERAVARDRRALVPLAALCFVASFWSKQSFVAAPLAATLFLWQARRAWLRPFLVTGLIGGLAVGAGLWLGAGPVLWENLVAANANPFSWAAVARFYRSFALTVPVLLALAGWQVVRDARKLTTGNRQSSIVNFYLVASVVVSLSIGKAGAWENYFLEPLWVVCALAGRALGAWRGREGWRAVAAPALVLAQLALFLPGFERRSPGAERAWLEGVRRDSLHLAVAVSEVRPGGDVWSEHMGVLAEAGHTVPLHSFVYTQLARQGLWNEGPLVARLARGEGAQLIQRCDAPTDPLGRDRWSRAMLDAGERGFALGGYQGGPVQEWCVRRPLPFDGPDTPRPASETIEMLNWMVVDWGNEQRITDVVLWRRVPPPIALLPQKPLQLHLLWQSQERIAEPLTVSVQLFAADGTRVAQEERPLHGELGGAWPTGALLRHEQWLSLREPLAPGAYFLEVALYESASGAERGRVRLEGFKVAPTVQVPAEAVERNVLVGDTLRLLAHDGLPATLVPGGTLTLRAWWRAEQSAAQPLTTFLHLTQADSVPLAQNDFQPLYPPTLWSAGETAEVRYQVVLPSTLPPGTYEIRLGWYDSATGARLAAAGEGTVESAAVLGTIRVEP